MSVQAPSLVGSLGILHSPNPALDIEDFNIMHSGAVQGSLLHIAGSFIEHAPVTFLVCQYISIDTRTVLIH